MNKYLVKTTEGDHRFSAKGFSWDNAFLTFCDEDGEDIDAFAIGTVIQVSKVRDGDDT